MFPEKSDFDSGPQPDKWRREVASRVNHYRVRRRRKVEGNYSMRLDFSLRGEAQDAQQEVDAHALAADQPRHREVCDTNYYRRLNAEAMGVSSPSLPAASAAIVPAPVVPVVEDPLLEPQPPSDPVPEPSFAVEQRVDLSPDPEPLPEPPRAAPQTNVIVFPRPLIEPPLAPTYQHDELAEPIFDRPRILDVPEGIVPTIDGPLFANVHLEPEDQEIAPQSPREFDFELPLQVALLPQRVAAAVTDWVIALAGVASFAAVSWKTLVLLPHTKPFVAAAILLPLVFWALYQYLFLVYSGQTVGMKMNHLRLSRFDGADPSWRDRKKRAFFTILSCISVGMGFLWAMVDEDSLGWHDRITRTFITQDE